MTEQKTIENIVHQWVCTNNERHKGERNALRRCGDIEAVKGSSGSWRIARLHNELRRHGHQLSTRQVLCLGWAFAHVRDIDMSEKHMPFGRFLAKHEIHQRRVDHALAPEDRETFVRYLIKILAQLCKQKIPAQLAKDILYFGPNMKFRWRREFDALDMVE